MNVMTDVPSIARRENVQSLMCKCGKTHTDANVIVTTIETAHNLCPDEGLYHRLRDAVVAKQLGCAWYDELGEWEKPT